VQASKGDRTLFSVSAPTTNSAMLFTVTSLDDVDQDLFVKVHCSAVLRCAVWHNAVQCSIVQDVTVRHARSMSFNVARMGRDGMR
jgi:hypothetical protein